MTTATLVKWGNGQGIRLPKATTEQLGLTIGDQLNIDVHGDSITITPARRRYITIPDYDALFRDYRGPQPKEDGFARPVGREVL